MHGSQLSANGRDELMLLSAVAVAASCRGMRIGPTDRQTDRETEDQTNRS